MTHAADLKQLSFRYAGESRFAVDGVNLAVNPGEILTVVGPSGSGKSTLLRLLTGLLTPTTGQVLVEGRDVTGDSPEQRPVAMVFQGYALFPHLDVAANLAFGLAVRKTPRAERRRRVVDVAERLGLTLLLHRLPNELSGGERQRVALGRALLRDPRVFCLDEPLSALDPVLRAAARRELEQVLRADGRCALHVTHDQAEAMALGDRVAVMREGAVEQAGTPRELYERPESTFVASFIGTYPMSLLAPHALGLEGRAGLATVGVRAEDVSLTPVAQGSLRWGTVTAVDDHGHESLVDVELPDGRLTALTPVNDQWRPGMLAEVGVGTWTGFDLAGRRLG